MFRWALWWPILVLGFPDADEASLAAMLSRPSPQDMGVEEAVRLAAESVPESFKKTASAAFRPCAQRIAPRGGNGVEAAASGAREKYNY
mmetsp:Transcript_17813/g.39318  ORF Transcript_17813/g.39318 Transcript_17813/m.39318 type:complete len:89 (-) Transcript_17813:43-309(-)